VRIWEVIEKYCRWVAGGGQTYGRIDFVRAASRARPHCFGSCSSISWTAAPLRETVVRADAGGLAKVSDVALLGRLRGSGEWFRWLVEQMSRRLSETSQEVLPGKRVRLVDASVVCEPGATGSTWRLHYMIDLTTLACEQVDVTLPDEGETLTRFAVRENDVLMADRGLAHRRGIRHVVKHKGDVIVRMNLVNVPLEDTKGRALEWLPRLRKLAVGKARAWPAVMRDEDGVIDRSRVRAQEERRTNPQDTGEAAPDRGQERTHPAARYARSRRLRHRADDFARRAAGADPRAVPPSVADRTGVQAPQVAASSWSPEEDRPSGREGVAARQVICRHSDRDAHRSRRAFFPLGLLPAPRRTAGGADGVR